MEKLSLTWASEHKELQSYSGDFADSNFKLYFDLKIQSSPNSLKELTYSDMSGSSSQVEENANLVWAK